MDRPDDHAVAVAAVEGEQAPRIVGVGPAAGALRAAAGNWVYEAHSTDYQRAGALRALVEDGFAILKVGPALTFVFREAVLALEAIEREWLAGRKDCVLSDVRATIEAAMLERPEHWRDHYQGGEGDRGLARLFSYSDRIRYYWPRPEVQLALGRLFANLSGQPMPPGLVSQYLPSQHAAVRTGEISCSPEALIRHKIQEVTRSYSLACDPQASSHRAAAFEAAEFLMDYLKTRAPFWKLEEREGRASAWVEARAEDDERFERWR